VVAAVVLAHGLALRWLSSAMVETSVLKPMVAPMFTRVLEQQAPAPVEAAAPAPVTPSRPAITSVQRRTPKPPKAPKPPRRAASQVVAQADSPAPAPAAEPPPEPASAPTPPTAPEPVAPAVEPTPTASAPAASTGTATDALTPLPAQAASGPASAASAATGPASSTPGSASLDSWPADTRLNYRLNGWFRGELYGSARVQWQRQESRYQARIEIDVTPFVSLAMTSQGDVTAQGLSPRASEEQRRSGVRGVELVDDAIVLRDGRRLPRPARVQDTASQFVELSHRFASGQERLEVGRSIDVWLARPGGVDLWTYDVVERQVLGSAELGAIETFHLKPRPIANPRGNIAAEIWFAPSLQYLPVRIRVNMGTDTYVDLMVEKIEQR
jgi:hypothetical protein